MIVNGDMNTNLFLKWTKPGLSLFIFVLFSTQWQIWYKKLNINGKRVDGELGIRTQDRRIVGTDESTELSRPHTLYHSQKKQSRQTGTRNLPNLSETFVRWGHIFRCSVSASGDDDLPVGTASSNLTALQPHNFKTTHIRTMTLHTVKKTHNR